MSVALHIALPEASTTPWLGLGMSRGNAGPSGIHTHIVARSSSACFVRKKTVSWGLKLVPGTWYLVYFSCLVMRGATESLSIRTVLGSVRFGICSVSGFFCVLSLSVHSVSLNYHYCCRAESRLIGFSLGLQAVPGYCIVQPPTSHRVSSRFSAGRT